MKFHINIIKSSFLMIDRTILEIGFTYTTKNTDKKTVKCEIKKISKKKEHDQNSQRLKWGKTNDKMQ